MKALLVVVAFAGCARSLPPVTPVPPSDADRAAIALTAEAWVQHGHPRPDGIGEVLVTDAADLATFHDLCGVCGPSAIDPDCAIRYHGAIYRGHACVTSRDQIAGPAAMVDSRRWSLIVLAPEQRTLDQREAILVYESVRWCSMLSGGDAGAGGQDNREIWCVDTCSPGSVEGDAREAVRRAR